MNGFDFTIGFVVGALVLGWALTMMGAIDEWWARRKYNSVKRAISNDNIRNARARKRV